MKKILITGANSYIGTSFESYVTDNFATDYTVDTLDMLDPKWQEYDFSKYDVVFHVAAIVHKKETEEIKDLYYKVNRDLVLEVANKAKKAQVGQFVFLSTVNVYGMKTGTINKNTKPCPNSHYGISKYQAEQGLGQLADDDFTVSIVRPPMVYGKGCKGNFQTVVKLVRKLPFFPLVKNERSLIYIDNLSSFVKMVIDRKLSGVFLPQNTEYMNTSKMAKYIAQALPKKLYLSRVLGALVVIARPFVSMLQKSFGNLVFVDTGLDDSEYCVEATEESVKKSV